MTDSQRVGLDPLTGHTKIESTARHLGVEIDDALAVAKKIEV